MNMSIQRSCNSWLDYLMYWIVSSVLIWTSFFLLFLLLIPSLRAVAIFYFIWMYYDRESCHTEGRKLQILRKMKFWRYRRDYFPIKLVKTANLPSDVTYLFCCFPHGLLGYGATTNFVCDINHFDKEFPGLNPYVMTVNMMFYIPFFRELLLALGVRAVSKEGISRVLSGSPGNVSVVLVGGLAEALKSSPSTYTLILKKRKGFVKMALKTGYLTTYIIVFSTLIVYCILRSCLVPVFSFGETDTFDQIPEKWYKWVPKKMKTLFGILLLLFYKGQGILPYKHNITTVVGKRIEIPKVEDPSNELVDKYHEIFINELRELFEKNKAKYDSRRDEATLTIQ